LRQFELDPFEVRELKWFSTVKFRSWKEKKNLVRSSRSRCVSNRSRRHSRFFSAAPHLSHWMSNPRTSCSQRRGSGNLLAWTLPRFCPRTVTISLIPRN
jgi:hypothetical protein